MSSRQLLISSVASPQAPLAGEPRSERGHCTQYRTLSLPGLSFQYPSWLHASSSVSDEESSWRLDAQTVGLEVFTSDALKSAADYANELLGLCRARNFQYLLRGVGKPAVVCGTVTIPQVVAATYANGDLFFEVCDLPSTPAGQRRVIQFHRLSTRTAGWIEPYEQIRTLFFDSVRSVG